MHRFADFGRLFLLLFIFLVLLFFGKKRITDEDRQLLYFSVLSTSVVILASLLIKNPMGHRYFVASYLMLSLLAFKLLINFRRNALIYVLLFFGLLIGNFIIYPDRIAQGWDSSLAHLPYHSLRQDAIEYMDGNDIEVNKTASFFPNRARIGEIDLNGDIRSFASFTGDEEHVLYSNLYNLTDKDFELLESAYDILREFKKGGVRIVLYKRSFKP